MTCPCDGDCYNNVKVNGISLNEWNNIQKAFSDQQKWINLNKLLPDLITESGNVFIPDIIECIEKSKKYDKILSLNELANDEQWEMSRVIEKIIEIVGEDIIE